MLVNQSDLVTQFVAFGRFTHCESFHTNQDSVIEQKGINES